MSRSLLAHARSRFPAAPAQNRPPLASFGFSPSLRSIGRYTLKLALRCPCFVSVRVFLSTFPCVSLLGMKKAGIISRLSPCHDDIRREPGSLSRPNPVGHTPRKLPVFTAISRFIAVRHSRRSAIISILAPLVKGFLNFFCFFSSVSDAVEHIPQNQHISAEIEPQQKDDDRGQRPVN